MLSKIYLVGANGNMGQRYQAILKHLRVPYRTCDVNHDQGIEDCDGVLIATPSYTHEMLIERFMHSYPVLCEKPIWQLQHNFNVRFAKYADGQWGSRDQRDYSKVRMINQYRHIVEDTEPMANESVTYYNYFKHGGDGLIWDCINIIGNMTDFDVSNLELAEDSPIWTCIINGRRLNLRDMDEAYVRELYEWIKEPSGNMQYFCEAHHRVFQLLEQFK